MLFIYFHQDVAGTIYLHINICYYQIKIRKRILTPVFSSLNLQDEKRKRFSKHSYESCSFWDSSFDSYFFEPEERTLKDTGLLWKRLWVVIVLAGHVKWLQRLPACFHIQKREEDIGNIEIELSPHLNMQWIRLTWQWPRRVRRVCVKM